MPALQAMLRQQFGHSGGLAQRANERHHHLNVGQAHVVAHTFDRFAFHGKGLAEGVADVARRAAKTQHGIFFFRLIARATNQLAVLVGLEVRQANNH